MTIFKLIQLLTTCVCNLFPWKYPRGQNRTHLPCWYTRLQLWTTIFSSCVINKRMDWKTNTIISSLCLSGHQNNGSIIGGNWLEQWNGRWVPTEFDWFNYRSQNLLRTFKQSNNGERAEGLLGLLGRAARNWMEDRGTMKVWAVGPPRLVAPSQIGIFARRRRSTFRKITPTANSTRWLG